MPSPSRFLNFYLFLKNFSFTFYTPFTILTILTSPDPFPKNGLCFLYGFITKHHHNRVHSLAISKKREKEKERERERRRGSRKKYDSLEEDSCGFRVYCYIVTFNPYPTLTLRRNSLFFSFTSQTSSFMVAKSFLSKACTPRDGQTSHRFIFTCLFFSV